MDSVQKTAFQKNTAAFLQYRNVLVIQQVLSFDSVDYRNPIDSDIGKTVTSDSGKTGTLVSFDNTAFTWNVVTTDSFLSGEEVTVNSGDGAAFLLADKYQIVFKGPYSAPTDKPCRKVWGITQRKPERFWLDWTAFCGLYWVNGLPNNGDYLSFWGNVSPFETGLNDDLTNEFTFSFLPSEKATYYWVYWQNPPSITGFDDASQLIIPEAYHLQYIQACNMARGMILEGGDFSDDVVEKYLGGWLDTLRAPFRDQKRNQNMTQGQSTGYSPYGAGGLYGGSFV